MTDRLHTDPDGCVTCRELREQLRRLQTGTDIESDSLTDWEVSQQAIIFEWRERLRHVARLLGVDSRDPREDILAAAVMRLRDQERWRPGSELPDHHDDVLVIDDDGCMCVAHYSRRWSGFLADLPSGECEHVTATHWRPLPEGPGDE